MGAEEKLRSPLVTLDRMYSHDVEALLISRDPSKWALYYMPYLIGYSTCFICQLSIYWTLGTFSTDVKSSSRTGGLFRAFETAGQAVSYAINSNTGDKRIPLYVMIVLLVLCIPTQIALIRLVPEKPKEHDDVADDVPPAVIAAKHEAVM